MYIDTQAKDYIDTMMIPVAKPPVKDEKSVREESKENEPTQDADERDSAIKNEVLSILKWNGSFNH